LLQPGDPAGRRDEAGVPIVCEIETEDGGPDPIFLDEVAIGIAPQEPGAEEGRRRSIAQPAYQAGRHIEMGSNLQIDLPRGIDQQTPLHWSAAIDAPIPEDLPVRHDRL
jgi:hypothetical protein